MPSMSLDDEELAMIVVAASHDMPTPAARSPEPLAVSDEQAPIPLGDEYNGEPGASSLRWEGQGVCTRPGTDIYVSGHAWAPRGKPVGQVSVGVRVGPCQRTAIVFGERFWSVGLSGRVPTKPQPFERIPLLYERCFGGTVEGARGKTAVAVDHNPVGRGLHDDPEQHPLPNIENPAELLSSPSDRPLPHGFGPVARGWLPRRSLAGTYSSTWVDTRAPLWPPDLDPRFFLAASPGLQAQPYLQGGEPVSLVGLHPDGPIGFELPSLRLVAKFYLADRVERRSLVLDAIMLEPDEAKVTSIWRASVIARPTMLAVEHATLRLLEPWEQAPPP